MKAILDRFAGTRVVVVGDAMLDEYVHGDVQRISPEAPVPVLEIRHRDSRLGGAANSAASAAGLDAIVTLLAVVGADAAGATLLEHARSAGVAAEHVLEVAGRRTTQKTRIVARGQHVVRIDAETRAPIDARVEERLCAAAVTVIGSTSAVVISDYAKGVVTDAVVRAAIEAARPRSIPVVIDSKACDYRRFRGATVLTPNQSELEAVVRRSLPSDEEVAAAGREVVESTDGVSVLVTRGPYGMTLVARDVDPVHLRTAARSVFDVTGAGDTVAATLAVALGSGASMRDAMRLANAAAGVAVSKAGTAIVSRDEILATFFATIPPP